MSSSLGRLAAGIAGAAIGSFFGAPALGFSIGASIGGFIFAPEGPNIEGPRIGDNDVTASTVGKIIPLNYGTTRSAGNIIWSGGIKEVKTKERQSGGGKGGGGGATTTTYSYFCSFALALGRGSAQNVLRIWADGKLIYDATSAGGSVKNDKYNFRLRSGVSDPNTEEGVVDPLIAESINRRLAGLPDVNEGNQPQANFRTIDAIIADLNSSSDPRSELYATYLTTLRDTAESGSSSPPDYGFTPSYKEVTYLVFDDMPLEDFGNRIPNITAEIVWSNTNVVDPNDTVSISTVDEISVATATPTNMMGVEGISRSALVISDDSRLRRFALSIEAETTERSVVLGAGINAERVLGSTASGDWIVRGSRPSGSDKLYRLDNISLTPKSLDTSEMSTSARTATFGCNAGVNGASELFAFCNPDGDFGLANVGASRVRDVGQFNNVGLGDGPMVYGGGEPGNTRIFWLSDNGSSFRLLKAEFRYGGVITPTLPVAFSLSFSNVITDFTTMDASRSLSGGSVSGLLYSPQSGRVFVIKTNSGGGGTIYEYDPDPASGDPFLVSTKTFEGTPPNIDSGISRSGTSFNQISFADGNNVHSVELITGKETVYTNVLGDTASTSAQVFIPDSAQLFAWVGGTPTLIRLNALSGGLYTNDLAGIISDVCDDVGMLPDEYDVSAIAGLYNVRGYTIARPSTGRAVLEKLFQAYFVDGVESDWKIKFKPQSSTPVRTIFESELGSSRGPTGSVPFMETRVPEQDLPAEISVVFTDPDRDYQQGSGHYRRVSQPTPSMYSRKIDNIEIPLVLTESEGRSIAERALFLAWMSRNQGKTILPWTHIDLDPADVVSIQFNDGRVITDRLINMQIGANFEMEVSSVRSSDPVFTESARVSINTSNVPNNIIRTPAFSKMFVLDMPLLFDYHDLNRNASRYYVAVGSDTTSFSSADLFQSGDGLSFTSFDSVNADCTWGTITSGPLAPPRALHSTDDENTFTVTLSVDNGDLSSTSDDDIATGLVNRALIVNTLTGDVEIIQFKNVTANPDGTYTFDTLVRGRRGTDYAVDKHETGEVFIYVTDATVTPQTLGLETLGTTQYFKAVPRGGLLATSPSVPELMESRDLKPYAPNYVRREDDGTDLTVLWNRRTRIGGAWNMIGAGIEEVPLNEDFEQYEFFLLPNTPTALADFNPDDVGTFVFSRTLSSTQTLITDADLSANGYTLGDAVNVAVYQRSAQVGRGFGRIVGLAP